MPRQTRVFKSAREAPCGARLDGPRCMTKTKWRLFRAALGRANYYAVCEDCLTRMGLTKKDADANGEKLSRVQNTGADIV